MNAKTTLTLVIALVIAVVALWWARSSTSKEGKSLAAAEAKRLLDPPLGVLSGFEVKAGTEPAMVFEMKDDKWRMTAPVAWPAEHFQVNNDATKIRDLKYVTAYPAGDPDRPAGEMSSLDNPPRIVKLTDKDGKSYVVKIGARQALSKKTYVQREGSDTIYLVDEDLNADLHKGLADYRAKNVAAFNQADAVRVEVAGDRQYTLVRGDNKWTVDSPVKGRGDAAKIVGMIHSIVGLTVQKFVEDSPKSLRPYRLEAPRFRVSVTTETKTPKPAATQPASAPAEPEYDVKTQTVHLAFGGAAEKEVFAKLDEEGQTAVFTVTEDALNQAVLPLDELRDKRVTAAPTNRVQRIVVSGGGESLELNKVEGSWQMTSPGQASAPAEFAAVDDFLRNVRNLTATGFETTESPAFGLASPRAVIELTSEGQLEPDRLTIGGVTASKTGAYVRNDREGFVAVVKSEAADALAVRSASFMSRELLKFTATMASKIEIARQDQRYEIVRQGGEWKFVSPIDGQAEAAAVNNVVTNLAGLRGRQAVGGVADAAKFGLDAPAAVVRLTVDVPPKPVKKSTSQPASQPVEPAVTPPASQPSSPPVAPPTTQPAEQIELVPQPPAVYAATLGRHEGKVYAMVEGGSVICEIDAKVLDDLEAELFDTRVLTLNPTEARRVEFSGAPGFAFEKSGADWPLVGEPSFQTDPAKITTLLNAMRDLRTKHYIKYSGANLAEYGLDQPAVTVKAETEGGQTAVLMISAKGSQGADRYGSSSAAAGRVFVISADDAAKFTKQVQDFRRGN